MSPGNYSYLFIHVCACEHSSSIIDKERRRVIKRNCVITVFLTFITLRDHPHIRVGQSAPSFPTSTICVQSCQLSFRIFHIFPVLSIHPCRGHSLLHFPCTTMSIIFLERLSSSLLLMCPCQFNLFCLRNVDIWHTLASSSMIYFLTCRLVA